MWLMLIMGSTNAWATVYEVGPGEYLGDQIISDYDILTMTGGWGNHLSMGGYSIANIKGTDPIKGVSKISVGGYSTLNLFGGNIGNIESNNQTTINMTSGSVNSIKMHSGSRSYLYGGQINTLASDQLAVIPNTTVQLDWIHIYCLPGYSYDDNLNLLSGQWGDGTPFDITLQDIGTSPTYDVIEFHIIPEPGTIILLGLGGICLKRRVNNYMRP